MHRISSECKGLALFERLNSHTARPYTPQLCLWHPLEAMFLRMENSTIFIPGICIYVFGYENVLVFPIYASDQKFEDSIDLLLLIDDDKSHYVYIKDFDRFMFHKTKN